MLKLENVSKYYYSSSSVTCALRNINLEFKLGEFISITGESGSGKTTLLNLISGFDSYEDGEMYYYNKPTSYFDNTDWENYREEEISFIFQNYNLIDSYTVLENVMVAYIIEGYSYSESKIKAKETLKFVGLQKDYRKKATKLSGGQKQRLAIARALAKNTNIIVADEPTGNLDSENGREVLSLLKKISKEKLIIVVTHNQAQIEEFATRKIRLHDGKVVSDETIEQSQHKEAKEKEKKKEKKKENYLKKVINFSFLNIKSQPNRAILMLFLLVLSTLSSFVFWGNFKANIDDSGTRIVSSTIFNNFDDKRVLVRKNESSIVTEQMLEEVKVEHVNTVEKFDYITDINYYRPTDYKKKFSGGWADSFDGSQQFIDSSSIILVNHSRYMRSASSINKDMLYAGRMPTNSFEMVVYSNDESILNTKELVLFRNERLWGIDSYYQYEVEIVGLLKEPTNQAYFSEDICKVLELTQRNINIRINYRKKFYSSWQNKYLTFNKIVIDPYIGDYDLSFDEARRKALVDAVYPSQGNTYVYVNQKTHLESFSFNITNTLKPSDEALGVSKEVFDYLYDQYMEKRQFALFLDDYAYFDEVKEELIEKDYEVISCYRSSLTGYNEERVKVRYINLLISIVALLLINSIIILLCTTILKFKKNDYVIMKMIGLKNKYCKAINNFELIIYTILSNIILIITSIIVKNNVQNELIKNIFKYTKFYDYILVFVISAICMIVVGRSFGKYLTKKVKVTTLKEE